ncbi:MAG: DUF1552 domain-containing protein, partial [Planctomycetota bacterium]
MTSDMSNQNHSRKPTGSASPAMEAPAIGTRRYLDRRTLLRGVGAAIALPLLDAMLPANVHASKTVAAAAHLKRIGYVYVPMGFIPKHWTPDGETLRNKNGNLPTSLQPLQSVENQVTVITNMDLQNAYPGSHATSNSAFLSAARAKLTESTDYFLGTTVDQIAAKNIG